jgi:hypothetical protein
MHLTLQMILRQLFTMLLWFLVQNLQTLSTIATCSETAFTRCHQQGWVPSWISKTFTPLSCLTYFQILCQ